ncbi:MAG: tetratricopeptide repeat protein, partial [Deltaproteobacteria bacterium]|nr:tetratricopeptide repeat protein [Deltaproteobacteria bacterium]
MLLFRATAFSSKHAGDVPAALEIAHRCQEHGDDDFAHQIIRQLAATSPEDPTILKALKTHAPPPIGAAREQDIAKLATRAKTAQHEDPALATRLLLRAAQICLHHDDTRDAAKNFLITARDICPPDARHELSLLETGLLEGGLDDDLATLFETRIQRSKAIPDQIKLLRALASHRAKRQRKPRAAAEALETLLSLDPEDEDAIAELRVLYHKLRDNQSLAKILDRQLERANDTTRAALLDELGSLYDVKHLNNEEQALRYYGELLRLQPHHQEALAVVRRHAERADDPRAVAVLLSRAAEADDNPETRSELHREIARIAENQLGDLDFAIGQWRQLLAIYPEQGEIRSELKRLLREAGRWSELEALLISDVSRHTSETERVRLYLELADLTTEELKNPRSAAAHLRNAQKLAPHDDVVLAKLASLHKELGQWRDLATIQMLRGDQEATPMPLRISLLLQAARVLFDHLGRHEEAQEICQRVQDLAPGEAKATTFLAEIYTHRKDWKRLASLLREEIVKEHDPLTLAKRHLELGELLLTHLNSPEAATTHFEMALEFNPESHEALALLRHLYATLGRWDLLVELVRRRAQAETGDKAARAEAFFEMAEIYREKLGDTTQARAAYTQALGLNPDLVPALSAQRAIAIDVGDWRDAVTLARREFDALEDPPDRSRLLVEIAQLLNDRLSRPDAAIDALEQALDEDSHNAEALDRLASATFATQHWERAIELLSRLVDSGEELPELHVHHYRLAYALERVDDEDRAFAHYVKSFGREPMYLPTLDRLVDLCYTRRQWENTLRIAEALISSYADDKPPQEIADLYVRLGLCEIHLAQTEIAQEKLKEMVLNPGERPKTPESAWQDVATSWASTPADPSLVGDVDFAVITRVIKAMEQALARVPGHTDALQLLAALTMMRGDWDRTLRYLERAADAADKQTTLPRNLLLAAG